MASIGIIEDDRSISELVKRTLEKSGHCCYQFFTGEEAVQGIKKEQLQLLLLDVGLPDSDGFLLIQRLPKLPTIYLTARDEITDRVKGLQLGAEDYIIKPFAMAELLARIDVVLRRYYPCDNWIELEEQIRVNLEEKRIYKETTELFLTTQEFLLLEALLVNKNIALSREQLLDIAWGIDYLGDTRTVDVHIQRLRSKLGLSQTIKTVFKYGYRLELE
ncbi:response regulator transcription factor [Enterococcus sp. DIV0756]|uniref:response regulator transcription factor n=1 Tax=Enterococcus sp. DIV0756 TaxID=2774636 RepID=UPI003F1FD8B5